MEEYSWNLSKPSESTSVFLNFIFRVGLKNIKYEDTFSRHHLKINNININAILKHLKTRSEEWSYVGMKEENTSNIDDK